MTFRKRYLRITHLLFIALLLIQLLPDKSTKDVFTSSLIIFAVGLEIIVLAASSFIKKEEGLSLLLDITGFVYVLLAVWSLATAKYNVLNDLLFPAPGKVIHQFTEDRSAILTNIVSSLGTTVKGFILAAVVAIPLGLFIGWSARVGGAATYITKFFSSIPPIVYIPYGIALLPTFKSVSVFVIFLATFWPVFAGTMSGVLGVDKKIIDSAKVLNVSKPEMLFRVILPASLQQIFLGCNQGLSVSFILLTSAEMIGARDGMGYYVKYYSDFGDYTRAITGLLVIGFVVIGVTFLFNKLQNRLLRWKR
ncbi:ABC transporter permease [Ruminococcus flavefaciens]|uniref:NitT/TauT family transport system permease protein n=1 Tax=Ruminococcus flavefaciens TaxID=1265 RepID=A0A1K1NCB1_RUMFL|nr:ABC transporter permease subunit [Ruminococcus flavefaciens]SFW32905.1 NitT/TauT family transport system permease protein [Ruminococcus flavefaciens]